MPTDSLFSLPHSFLLLPSPPPTFHSISLPILSSGNFPFPVFLLSLPFTFTRSFSQQIVRFRMYVRNGLISLSKRERNSLRSACLGSLGRIKLQLSLLRDPELLPVLVEHFCGSSIYR